MKFTLTSEQRDFGSSLDALLSTADVPAAARSWAEGDHGPGLALWKQLADSGVAALLVPEDHGGLGGDASDVAVAFERLGYHAVPGPWLETAVVAPLLFAAAGDHERLEQLAAGELVVSVAAPPLTPRALDADIAARTLLLDGLRLMEARPSRRLVSVDPTRRLFDVDVRGEVATIDGRQAGAALDAGALACAATLLGAGNRLLSDTVTYVTTRRQFGRPVGEYQALKHALADVLVGLDFARPLVHGAALSLQAGLAHSGRDVAAAKVAAGDAAYRASRVALQLHGAVGYTLELDLSLWLLKVRALVSAWGTPAHHRGRVMSSLTHSPALNLTEV